MEPMRKLQEYFVEYTNEKEFFCELQKKMLWITNGDAFRENIERKIWPMLSQTRFFIIEDDYTETEWKDMISEHYIHTKYVTSPTVARIHLFNEEQDISKAYLGCFTLRKINSVDTVLSFIYPNWDVLCLRKQDFSNSYLITATKCIHIFAEEIKIKTTPYFVQDGMVASCAHASILMMTHFLNLKFGYKKLCIKDVNQSYLNREKMFPTRGLLPEQVMEVLTNNGINVVEYELGGTRPSGEERAEIKERVKAHLRSGMPIMLGIDGHGVLIVGFRETEDEFLFLDDSGALIHSLNKEKFQDSKNEYDNFISSCRWDYIFNYIEARPDDLIQFLMPVHERIYCDYEDVSYRCSILEKSFGHDDKGTTYEIQDKRFFMAENAKCKKFVNENILDRENAGELLDTFICYEQPHYLWCYEFKFEGEIYIIFINTTYNIESDENNIYINKDCEPFHIARHFHTVDKVKTIENMKVPLFAKKRFTNVIKEKIVEEKLSTKVAHIPKKDVEGGLITFVETPNPSDPSKKKKGNKEKKKKKKKGGHK